MKKIGFDIDGVLYPWHMYVWTDLYLRGVIDFEYNYFWKYAWKEYSEGWWYSLVEDESYYFNNPFYDARETINHFKLNLGWDVYAITVRGVKSNNKSLQSGTRWWFNEHKLFVDDIFFSEDKDKIVRNLKLDLFVEDKPESIESIGKVCKVIPRLHSHNEDYLRENNLQFIKSLSELKDHGKWI